MEVTVQFNARLPIKVRKRKNWYLASCPVFDVHSQGETERKAKKNLAEALSLFLISCFERGTLDQVLKDCGFKPAHPVTGPQKTVRPGEDYINVPLPFIVQRQLRECHA
ncbi:MAG: hypothetical protein JRH08_03785 [Deltaproteobacteria bacterium]|nr:hypothetical protein [Deltaproteobacteria bacterium]MBW1927546.1 hypothetical protein [Deltaproteobacteria bacterium]MBW2026527.1 hypothetical protein [Deltaproteobacteria bacterium]MBW2124819.1 hypothetical protein [Deltaproteobacteria bacterium]RLB22393.1 MAG: hypothetical protein DRG76_06775 [Deltaproteobacteria bacterium]